MRVIKWVVLSVVAVGTLAVIEKLTTEENQWNPDGRPAVRVSPAASDGNKMASPIDKVDPVTGERGVGFAIQSNENRQVGLVVANWGGQLQIALVDAGVRFWMPDNLVAGRDKLVMFKNDAMHAPDRVAMTVPKGDSGTMFLVTSDASVRRYMQGEKLYIRVEVPNETFSFDMHGDIVQNQLKAMGVAN